MEEGPSTAGRSDVIKRSLSKREAVKVGGAYGRVSYQRMFGIVGGLRARLCLQRVQYARQKTRDLFAVAIFV